MDNLQKLQTYLRSVLDEPTMKKWIDPLKYIGTLEGTLFLGAPDKKNMQWVRQNLLEDINHYTRTHFDFITKIVPLDDEESLPPQAEDGRRAGPESRLQKRYTFESLVQSDS